MPARKKPTPYYSGAQPDDLAKEIDMLRGLMEQLAEKAAEEEDAVKQARILAALSQAGAHIAQIRKVQSQLGGGDELINKVREVAERVRRQLEQPDAQ